RQRETGEGVFWTRPLGNGRIVVSGLGTLFTNRALGLADNGRLLSKILRRHYHYMWSRSRQELT
ncbi:MAG: hypothetical protein KGL35_24155, partial [Bradyrhizobium sp.]|nr:hypothetical protein [Bradyrhizobium sp.]